MTGIEALADFLFGVAMYFLGYWMGVRQAYREARQLYEKIRAAQAIGTAQAADLLRQIHDEGA